MANRLSSSVCRPPSASLWIETEKQIQLTLRTIESVIKYTQPIQINVDDDDDDGQYVRLELNQTKPDPERTTERDTRHFEANHYKSVRDTEKQAKGGVRS